MKNYKTRRNKTRRNKKRRIKTRRIKKNNTKKIKHGGANIDEYPYPILKKYLKDYSFDEWIKKELKREYVYEYYNYVADMIIKTDPKYKDLPEETKKSIKDKLISETGLLFKADTNTTGVLLDLNGDVSDLIQQNLGTTMHKTKDWVFIVVYEDIKLDDKPVLPLLYQGFADYHIAKGSPPNRSVWRGAPPESFAPLNWTEINKIAGVTYEEGINFGKDTGQEGRAWDDIIKKNILEKGFGGYLVNLVNDGAHPTAAHQRIDSMVNTIYNSVSGLPEDKLLDYALFYEKPFPGGKTPYDYESRHLPKYQKIYPLEIPPEDFFKHVRMHETTIELPPPSPRAPPPMSPPCIAPPSGTNTRCDLIGIWIAPGADIRQLRILQEKGVFVLPNPIR